MDIIVDGYNATGSDQRMHGALEKKRDRLIQRLSIYQTMKKFGMIVVLTVGAPVGLMKQKNNEKVSILIVYSRQGEKADDVIVRMARQKGSGCVVVTSDREVRKAVEKFGAAAVYAGEFRSILRNLDQPSTEDEDENSTALPMRGGNPKRPSRTERRASLMPRILAVLWQGCC
jgi:predicted RNA-binding protein with PIN domain